MRHVGHACLFLVVAGLAVATAGAEVVYLTNGDTVHGTLVAANNNQVTLKTPYGELVIPKKDIAKIDYGGLGAPSDSGKTGAAPGKTVPTDVPAAKPSSARAAITLRIQGRSFWYAFDSPPGVAADPSIRFRFYVGDDRACTFVDEKPDTVDGATLYNSFTFSPTDSRLLEALEGYDCAVQKPADGAVILRVQLPPGMPGGVKELKMLYEVNEGDLSSPRWLDAVARTFSLEVEPGKEAVAVLEQNADALEYTGFFKKKMKNVDLFKVGLVSTELKD